MLSLQLLLVCLALLEVRHVLGQLGDLLQDGPAPLLLEAHCCMGVGVRHGSQQLSPIHVWMVAVANDALLVRGEDTPGFLAWPLQELKKFQSNSRQYIYM